MESEEFVDLLEANYSVGYDEYDDDLIDPSSDPGLAVIVPYSVAFVLIFAAHLSAAFFLWRQARRERELEESDATCANVVLGSGQVPLMTLLLRHLNLVEILHLVFEMGNMAVMWSGSWGTLGWAGCKAWGWGNSAVAWLLGLSHVGIGVGGLLIRRRLGAGETLGLLWPSVALIATCLLSGLLGVPDLVRHSVVTVNDGLGDESFCATHDVSETFAVLFHPLWQFGLVVVGALVLGVVAPLALRCSAKQLLGIRHEGLRIAFCLSLVLFWSLNQALGGGWLLYAYYIVAFFCCRFTRSLTNAAFTLFYVYKEY